MEVVFSDGAAGNLLYAQRFGAGKWKCPIATDGLSKEDQSNLDRYFEQERIAWQTARPLGGCRDDILTFPFLLSFGDISEDIPGKKRIASLAELYRGNAVDPEEQAQYTMEEASNLDRLSNASDLRTWYSDAPDELCGFAFLMERLTAQGFQGTVQAVKLPCPYVRPDGTADFYHSWGQVESELWEPLSHAARDISPVEQQGWANIWRGLRAQNAPLRAVMSGQLTGVPQNFYDAVIRQQIAALDPEFEEGLLVGRVISSLPGLYSAFISLRLQVMVERGELEVIRPGNSDIHAAAYWRRLRRTARFSEI